VVVSYDVFTCVANVGIDFRRRQIALKGKNVTTRKKLLVDFEYEEVLDAKTRRLIQAGCAVAAGCPT